MRRCIARTSTLDLYRVVGLLDVVEQRVQSSVCPSAPVPCVEQLVTHLVMVPP